MTCFSKTWKVVYGIVVAKLQVHINQYTSTAQEGVGDNIRSYKLKLMIERAVTNDSRSRQTDQST